MTHREYEYMKPSKMPDWMKDFAEKEAFGKKEGNYIDHINEILHPESKMTTVEARVKELRDRVGLDQISKQAENKREDWLDYYFKSNPKMLQRAKRYCQVQGKSLEQFFREIRKTTNPDLAKQILFSYLGKPGQTGWTPPKQKQQQKKKSSLIDQLVIMANELDDSGMYKEARAIDKRIMSLANKSEDDKKSDKKSENNEQEGIADIVDDPKFRKILEFIDKVVEGRGGKVTSVSIQAMIENEKGFDMSNPEVQKYLENKIKAVRESSPDMDESSGLFGTDIQEEDRAANNQMFHMPETDMG